MHYLGKDPWCSGKAEFMIERSCVRTHAEKTIFCAPFIWIKAKRKLFKTYLVSLKLNERVHNLLGCFFFKLNFSIIYFNAALRKETRGLGVKAEVQEVVCSNPR